MAGMGLDSSDNAVALSGQGIARSSGSATAQLKHSLWVTWSELAIEHEATAWGARSRALSASGPADRSDPMEDEFKSSLQAVTTAALALDALYVPVKQLAPIASTNPAPVCPRNRPARAGLIREALKRAFSVGTLNKRWVQEFKWLFALRDGAVHYRESAEDPAPHPRGMSVSKAYSTYRAEDAKRAVDLLMEVLHSAAEQPRPNLKDAVKWSADVKPSVRKLDALRARSQQTTNSS